MGQNSGKQASSFSFQVNGFRLWPPDHHFRSLLPDPSIPIVRDYYESSTKIINNRRLPYVGWYTDPDGYIRKSFNTNFMFDTHIPNLKLGFSLSAQCLWFSNQQTEWKAGFPNII